MKNPIVKQKTRNNHHVVSWPDLGPVSSIAQREKLLKLVFNECRAWQAGFILQLNESESDILWVDASVAYQDVNNYYSNYLQDMYKIKGVVFNEENCADKFYNILEKKLMWRILNG